MTNPLVSRTSASDLNKQIEQHLQELAEATDHARTSEEMVRYLDFCAKFHQYSAGNIWLILMAKPEATYVSGYQKWKSLGRWVRQGEHGIPILAPMLVKEEDEDASERQHLIGFRVVYVYDVSQTEGDKLPTVPKWKSPERSISVNKRLIEFAAKKGIKVTIEPLRGETQSVSMGGRIILSPEAGTKTLIHEIAHELLHQVKGYQFSRAEKEMEAESVAYVVCSFLGFTNLSCPNYIALHGLESSSIFSHSHRIRNLANQVILKLEEGIDFCP